MAIHFHRASPFEENRIRIEDFIFRSILEIQKDVDIAIRGVEAFAKAIDKLVDTLVQMYQSASPKDLLSEKSSPIGDGRYRVFYKVTIRSSSNQSTNDLDITLLDIDDNREANLDRFPSHRLRTFVSEEDS